MDVMETVLLCALGLFALLTLVRFSHGPLGHILRLLGNGILGFLALWVTQLTAGFTGISLGLNLWNALVIGVLGLPGFAFLLLAQWALF